jgi:hypothetical protein
MLSRIKHIISKQKEKFKKGNKVTYGIEHEEVVKRMKCVMDSIASD